MNFIELTKILKNYGLPIDIIRQNIWPMLSYPHEGRVDFCKEQLKLKNACLKQLPSLEMWSGPKIIYNLERLKHLFDLTCHKNYPPSVKFMYILKYSKKYPNEYINILEYVTLTPQDFEYINNEIIMNSFTTKIREIYHEPLDNKKNILLSTPLIYSPEQ